MSFAEVPLLWTHKIAGVLKVLKLAGGSCGVFGI